MTNDQGPSAEETEGQDVCPHCGSVLELARAVEGDRSVLRARGRKAAPPPEPAEGPADPSVA